MDQIFQNLKTGEVTLERLPRPSCGPGQVLVETTVSLVSLGTEKMLLDFGKAGWLAKAKSQPEKVAQVLTKIKTDGLAPTLDAVRRKLDQPIPLGYSAVGIVREIGSSVAGFKVGDRVVTNGPHAQYVLIGKNLISKIPENVPDESAAFTVVGSIGLQGVRLLDPTFGETIVVVGLGLIGLLTVQVLISNGCNVIGFDFDEAKVRLAQDFGAKAFVPGGFVDPVREALNLSNGEGVDGVIITASTSSDDVISQAAQMTRKRGRVILVGVIGLDLKRSDFYEKEISFQVSCSYGPGRYDPVYEEKGLDYPLGFVRWTEARNFEAFLMALSKGSVKTEKLITTRVSFTRTPQLYSELGQSKGELGVLIQYDGPKDSANTIKYSSETNRTEEKTISVLGAGQFAGAVLLPAFKVNGFKFETLASRSGPMGPHLAKKYDFKSLTSDYQSVLDDSRVKTVVISTRHNSHGKLVLESLIKGKNVFVEKPLAIDEREIDAISEFFSANINEKKPILMVGFNRRFSPMAIELKRHLQKISTSKAFVMTVNAGFLPKDHWTQDVKVGGGRLVGEGCHFIDLLRYLSGSSISTASVTGMTGISDDTYSIQIKFQNGDIGTIHYFSNGSKDFAKERLEVFSSGKVVILDNFRSLRGLGFKGLMHSTRGQNKGHVDEIKAFMAALESGVQPVEIDELLEVSRWSIKLQRELLSLNGRS